MLKGRKYQTKSVEGKDEENFFKCFLKNKNIDGIQIILSEGRDNFKNILSAVKEIPNFDTVNALGVIRDADDTAKGAFDSVCSVLENNGLY